MYRYKRRHSNVLGSITLPRESSQLILMWFDYGMQKINTAGPGEGGHESCIKHWPMVEHVKRFLASSHTTSTTQSPEQPSGHKE